MEDRQQDVAYGNDGYAPMYLSDGVIYGLTTSYSGSSAGAFAIDAANGVISGRRKFLLPRSARAAGQWAEDTPVWWPWEIL